MGLSSAERFLIRGLARTELFLRGIRQYIRRSARATALALPNDALAWGKLYSTPMTPVHGISSPIAQTLVDISHPGDVLLETGCGTASISAQLALSGRQADLCDFSQPILDRACKLFELSGLRPPRTTLCDLTSPPLPMPDRSVDIAWSSGVLEHWTDAELVPIVKELARISRRGVVSFVPYAGCAFYRWGKHVAEKSGSWRWGRELPRETLRPVFEQAGLKQITESTICPETAVTFLDCVVDDVTRLELETWLGELDKTDVLLREQGYLLLTIGHIPC